MVNTMRLIIFNSCYASQKKTTVSIGTPSIDCGSQRFWGMKKPEHPSFAFLCAGPAFVESLIEQFSEQKMS